MATGISPLNLFEAQRIVNNKMKPRSIDIKEDNIISFACNSRTSGKVLIMPDNTPVKENGKMDISFDNKNIENQI